MMVTVSKLELNTPVLKTDREEENKEDDGDHKTGASLVIIDQGVRVIAVVGVPAPVEHYHPKGAYHEDKDEQSAINKLSKFWQQHFVIWTLWGKCNVSPFSGVLMSDVRSWENNNSYLELL